MRIVITSPPKTGNKWLKCLLGSIYDLDWLRGDDTPGTNPRQFRQWVDQGGFNDGRIFHQHCRYTPQMADAIASVPAHAVTIVRDPYDQFVSLFYWLQTRAASDQQRNKVRPRERPRDVLIGKTIDDPAALAYLGDKFKVYLERADGWLHSDRSVVFRYEELHRDPVAELKRGTDLIQPVDEEKIVRAVSTCSAENMRQQSAKMAQHVRSASVGDSKQRLSEPHLAIFRDQYADLVRGLGYEVR
jgi:hypothetical protein